MKRIVVLFALLGLMLGGCSDSSDSSVSAVESVSLTLVPTAAHAVGFPVQVWTINTYEGMLAMIDLGVDGIMTDAPVLLEQILSTPPAQRSCESFP